MDFLWLVSPFILNKESRDLSISRAILGTFVFGLLALLLPADLPVDRNGKIDWIGALLGTSGLIVFNVAWK